MTEFESGVKGYIRAKATVYVSFPIDMKGVEHKNCNSCPYHYMGRSGNICELTEERLINPEKYVGNECLLKIITEQEWREHLRLQYEKRIKED